MSIMQHLPALQVAIPLLAAPLCAMMVRPTFAWPFAVGAAWLTFAISIALMDQVLSEGTITYNMGGWAPPWGISYVIDPLNALLLLLVSGMAAIIIARRGFSSRSACFR
jgi:multicomponent Na+:H+ antiporter subunit D